MQLKGRLYILSNKENIPVFFKEINTNYDFSYGIREFVDKYQLNTQIPDDDYLISSTALADSGYIVFIEDNIRNKLTLCMPRKITMNEINWLKVNKQLFIKDNKISSLNLDDGIENIDFETFNNISEVINSMEDKYLSDNKKGSGSYVR